MPLSSQMLCSFRSLWNSYKQKIIYGRKSVWTTRTPHATLASSGLELAAPNSLDASLIILSSSPPSGQVEMEYGQELLQLLQKPSYSQALCTNWIAY
eukprot:scaffold2761_cov264-Chaetoceros_neogracile.AAC.4